MRYSLMGSTREKQGQHSDFDADEEYEEPFLNGQPEEPRAENLALREAPQRFSYSKVIPWHRDKQTADAAHDDGLWILQEPVLFQGHENENRGEYENAQPEPVGKHRPSSCVIGGTIG